MYKKLGVLLMILILGGCGKPLYTFGYDKQVEPEKEKALVVYYMRGLPSSTSPCFLYMDGKLVGGQWGMSKSFVQAKPGHHIVSVANHNPDPFFGGYNFAFFEGDLEAGKVYYIKYGIVSQGTGGSIKATNPIMEGGETEDAFGDFTDSGIVGPLSLDGLVEITDRGREYEKVMMPDLIVEREKALAKWRNEGSHQPLRASSPAYLYLEQHSDNKRLKGKKLRNGWM